MDVEQINLDGKVYIRERSLGFGSTSNVSLFRATVDNSAVVKKVLRDSNDFLSLRSLTLENQVLQKFKANRVDTVPNVYSFNQSPTDTSLIIEYVDESYQEISTPISDVADLLSILRQSLEMLQVLHTDIQRSYIDMHYSNFRWNAKESKLKVIDWNVLSKTKEEILLLGKDDSELAVQMQQQGEWVTSFEDLVICDLTRLGTYLYSWATGKKALVGESESLLSARAGEKWGKLSLSIRNMILKAIHINPYQRYHTAQDFLEDVNGLSELYSYNENDLLTYTTETIRAATKSKSGQNWGQFASDFQKAQEILDILHVRNIELYQRYIVRLEELGEKSGVWASGMALYRAHQYFDALEKFKEENGIRGDLESLRWIVISEAMREASGNIQSIHEIEKLADALASDDIREISDLIKTLQNESFAHVRLNYLLNEGKIVIALNRLDDHANANVDFYQKILEWSHSFDKDYWNTLSVQRHWPDFEKASQDISQAKQRDVYQEEILGCFLDRNKTNFEKGLVIYQNLLRSYPDDETSILIAQKFDDLYKSAGENKDKLHWLGRINQVYQVASDYSHAPDNFLARRRELEDEMRREQELFEAAESWKRLSEMLENAKWPLSRTFLEDILRCSTSASNNTNNAPSNLVVDEKLDSLIKEALANGDIWLAKELVGIYKSLFNGARSFDALCRLIDYRELAYHERQVNQRYLNWEKATAEIEIHLLKNEDDSALKELEKLQTRLYELSEYVSGLDQKDKWITDKIQEIRNKIQGQKGAHQSTQNREAVERNLYLKFKQQTKLIQTLETNSPRELEDLYEAIQTKDVDEVKRLELEKKILLWKWFLDSIDLPGIVSLSKNNRNTKRSITPKKVKHYLEQVKSFQDSINEAEWKKRGLEWDGAHIFPDLDNMHSMLRKIQQDNQDRRRSNRKRFKEQLPAIAKVLSVVIFVGLLIFLVVNFTPKIQELLLERNQTTPIEMTSPTPETSQTSDASESVFGETPTMTMVPPTMTATIAPTQTNTPFPTVIPTIESMVPDQRSALILLQPDFTGFEEQPYVDIPSVSINSSGSEWQLELDENNQLTMTANDESAQPYYLKVVAIDESSADESIEISGRYEENGQQIVFYPDYPTVLARELDFAPTEESFETRKYRIQLQLGIGNVPVSTAQSFEIASAVKIKVYLSLPDERISLVKAVDEIIILDGNRISPDKPLEGFVLGIGKDENNQEYAKIFVTQIENSKELIGQSFWVRTSNVRHFTNTARILVPESDIETYRIPDIVYPVSLSTPDAEED